MGPAQLLQLGPETVSLTYSATAVLLKDNVQNNQELFYITSIWARRFDKWVNIFSQDTRGSDQS